MENIEILLQISIYFYKICRNTAFLYSTKNQLYVNQKFKCGKQKFSVLKVLEINIKQYLMKWNYFKAPKVQNLKRLINIITN